MDIEKPKFQLLNFDLNVYENVTDFPSIEINSKLVFLESGKQITQIELENIKVELIKLLKNNIKVKEVK